MYNNNDKKTENKARREKKLMRVIGTSYRSGDTNLKAAEHPNIRSVEV